ncbi:hydantoinase B/oxoprolinase family protein [Rugamonas apoptosis]|uniref:Hydantoinase B/oxoprolinase family protein n=1 Tax=Rugamonas apoptosis TaxID=2758570 RepID=A0A7W2FBP2_9BURK|nr:hydantoinase B/oxoprolinase family protein [Rugamonas apoptosis]MBA5688644.1 hydantoinase B/oxoprolinase family protein [Rugamonas apoptosis]
MKNDIPTHQLRWQFWVDRGGTFTDIVARRPDGKLVTHKLLSEYPERYDDAVTQGMRDMLGLKTGEPLPVEQIEVIKMGTTVATNALLERKGARTALAITRGFADQLRIGYQDRPDIFAMHIELPDLIYEEVIEVDERIGAHGAVLAAPDEEVLRGQFAGLRAKGIDAIAIVLMHAYRYPQHELRLRALAEEAGFGQISVSHQVSPLMKIVGRGDTTVVDAYLSPVLRDYVSRVSADTGSVRLMFMQSNGGLTDASRFQGKDAILSGPAGGIVGAVKSCEAIGLKQVIGFDMGGTSTDVAHYDSSYERVFETVVAGVRVRAPMMHIHTVAAGGGSICSFEHGRFKVGPESAGANPGPASYRKGGPLTVTDCNVMLGRIQPEHFPHVFGPNGDLPLDRDEVVRRFTALAAQIERETGTSLSPSAVADGFLAVAVDNMAQAIKSISVERGYDVSRYAMCCFGGAGGQHACRVADVLGMTQIVIHPFAGVLSAFGMGLADIRAMREAAVEQVLSEATLAALQPRLGALARDAGAELLAQQVAPADIKVELCARIKYQDSDSAFVVPVGGLVEMAEAFAILYRGRFGFVMEGQPLVIESVSAEAIGEGKGADFVIEVPAGEQAAAPGEVLSYVDGQTVPIALHVRAALPVGSRIAGPAIIREEIATTVVDAGWSAKVLPDHTLLLERTVAAGSMHKMTTAVHPIHLEIFNNLFMAIAKQMGTTLENTAYSVNMKERLDFSCAIFDRHGNLIANAPHIPVHLGSMSDSVQCVIREHGASMAPGDAYVLNVPYNGGTHLPDITVVSPVFSAEHNAPPFTVRPEPLFYVAARGHHGDVGGITPGSMPPNSTTILEEGVLLDNIKIVDQGVFLEPLVRELFGAGPWPSRNIDQNIADLIAQLGACETGANELLKAVATYGEDVVLAYMQHVQDNAEAAVRQAISGLRDASFEYEMDDGALLKVSLTIDHASRSATVDFTGTSAQRPTNFNAPLSVCKAAVLYVFRTLLDSDIPMNEGVLKPLNLIIPQGSMLNPVYPAAVVAGNVEVSQYVTDALYGALGVLSASQGTMNNFTFGNAEHQYYETIAGGSGAGPGFNGTAAVQTHMTNSRMTDPEVLEWRFPVLVETHAIRRGSGGAGRHQGGDGALRRIRFLEGMTANILAGHRRVAPFGLDGAAAGALGRNWVERSDGSVEQFGATHTADMRAGDVFAIETPGGGGYGA